MEAFDVLLLKCFILIQIFLFDVEPTDFDVLCTVMQCNKRVSKFMQCFCTVLMYCAILLIYFELNASHSLFDVELTDFAVLCAVIFVNKRVS